MEKRNAHRTSSKLGATHRKCRLVDTLVANRQHSTLVFYHKEDADGLVSAAIIWCWMYGLNTVTDTVDDFVYDESKITDLINNINNIKEDEVNILPDGSTVEFKGTSYAELSDMVLKAGGCRKLITKLKEEYTDIIMADISFNEPEVMPLLYKEYKENMCWFDHHKPIIDASYKYKFNGMYGIRDTCTSAAMLVYHFFYGTSKMSSLQYSMENSDPLLRGIAGFDSWNPTGHKYTGDTALYDTEVITRGLETLTGLSLKKTVYYISSVLAEDVLNDLYTGKQDRTQNLYIKKTADKFIDDNNSLLNCIKHTGEVAITTRSNIWKTTVDQFGDFTFKINNEWTCVLFMQARCASTVFSFLKDTNTKHVAVFKRIPTTNKKKQWTISVYNVNDDDTLHVGNYLKERYGGGGHSGCGGCTVSQTQFNKIMSSKEI